MTPEQFETQFDLIADALHECDGITNQDLAGDVSTQIATFSMDIDSDDTVDAFSRGLAVVRTSLHAAGGATPGWEKHFEEVRNVIESVTANSHVLLSA